MRWHGEGWRLRKVKKVLAFHFDERPQRPRDRDALRSCVGDSVAQTPGAVRRLGLTLAGRPATLDEEVLEAALYRRSRASDWPDVDWAKV